MFVYLLLAVYVLTAYDALFAVEVELAGYEPEFI